MNLIDKIDNHLLSKDKRKRVSHYPSDVSKCMRQLYYKWTDEVESDPITAGGFWKMSMGNKIHELIYDFLENSGLEVCDEVSFRKKIPGLEYEISGRIDVLFIDSDGKLAGIENKSTYGAGVRALQKNGPKNEDISQVVMYMGLTDVKKFYFIYVGRDDGYRTQFVLEFKDYENLFLSLVEKLKKLEMYLTKKELPNRDYMAAIKKGEIKQKYQKDNVEYKTDWQCSYCQWKNLCWKDDIEKYKNSDNSEMFNGKLADVKGLPRCG